MLAREHLGQRQLTSIPNLVKQHQSDARFVASKHDVGAEVWIKIASRNNNLGPRGLHLSLHMLWPK